MNEKQQDSKINSIIKVDLCIDAVIMILGAIALLCFRERFIEAFEYLKNIDLFAVAQILILILLVFLSFFTDIRYIASKEPSFVVERYAIVWGVLKIISIVFFLLTLLII